MDDRTQRVAEASAILGPITKRVIVYGTALFLFVTFIRGGSTVHPISIAIMDRLQYDLRAHVGAGGDLSFEDVKSVMDRCIRSDDPWRPHLINFGDHLIVLTPGEDKTTGTSDDVWLVIFPEERRIERHREAYTGPAPGVPGLRIEATQKQ